MKIFSLSFLFSSLMLIMAGCTPRATRSASFLGEDLAYHADPQDADVLIYSNPNIKVSSYSKFLIDPVKIFSNDSHGIKPLEQTEIANSFRNEIIARLQDHYGIVDKPGPGVLRIQTAIQDIQPARLELDENKFLVIRLDTVLSRVAMELKCVDSLSNEPVAALIHSLSDKKYFEKEKTERLLRIRDAFRVWTKTLRERLDAARLRPKPGFEGPETDEHRRLRFEEGE